MLDQRDRGTFTTVASYREHLLGKKIKKMQFNEDSAVTLEVSALQYFPWIRPMCERAIQQGSLIPGRFIAVRNMKESEADGDLPAIVAALDIIGSSFVETLAPRPGAAATIATKAMPMLGRTRASSRAIWCCGVAR